MPVIDWEKVETAYKKIVNRKREGENEDAEKKKSKKEEKEHPEKGKEYQALSTTSENFQGKIIFNLDGMVEMKNDDNEFRTFRASNTEFIKIGK